MPKQQRKKVKLEHGGYTQSDPPSRRGERLKTKCVLCTNAFPRVLFPFFGCQTTRKPSKPKNKECRGGLAGRWNHERWIQANPPPLPTSSAHTHKQRTHRAKKMWTGSNGMPKKLKTVKWTFSAIARLEKDFDQTSFVQSEKRFRLDEINYSDRSEWIIQS